MVRICPRCQQRYTTSKFNTDYVHECNSQNLTLDQETVRIIGNWEDYTGSGTELKFSTMMRGSVNQLQGQRAGLEGANFDGVDKRGNRKATHRSRQHLEYIDTKDLPPSHS